MKRTRNSKKCLHSLCWTVCDDCIVIISFKSFSYSLWCRGILLIRSHDPLFCSAVGRLLIEFSSQITLERVQRENPNVTEGGKYTPPDCRPKQKVAIIIPFRHRDNHLKYWLHYLHPVLRRQKIDYGIYIINQVSVCMCVCVGQLSFWRRLECIWCLLENLCFRTWCLVSNWSKMVSNKSKLGISSSRLAVSSLKKQLYRPKAPIYFKRNWTTN